MFDYRPHIKNLLEIEKEGRTDSIVTTIFSFLLFSALSAPCVWGLFKYGVCPGIIALLICLTFSNIALLVIGIIEIIEHNKEIKSLKNKLTELNK